MATITASKTNLSIVYDTYTKEIITNDSLAIVYSESSVDLIIFTESTNSFTLIADLVNSDIYNVGLDNPTLSLDVGFYNYTINAAGGSFPSANINISLSVEVIDTEVTPPPPPPPTESLKYWLEYTDTEANEFRCEIWEKGFEGAESQIYGYCDLKYNNRKDVFDTIISSNLSINLEANTTVTLQDLYSEEEQTFKVKFFRNSELLFIGFIKPDGIYQDYVSDKWMLSIDCYDGLNILKDLSFVTENGLFYTAPMSELNVIYNALKRIKLDLPINIDIRVFNDKYNPTIYNTVLEQVFINTERFYQDAEKEKIMDCESVIKSILDTYNACIFQQDGEWFILRTIDMANSMTFKRYVEGIFSNNNVITTNKFIGSHIDAEIETFDAIHANSNQRISIAPSCQAFRVHYKYGTVSSVVDNENLQLGEGLNIDGWTVNNPDGKVFRNVSGYGVNADNIEHYSSDIYYNGLDSQQSFIELIRNNPIDITSGDILIVSINYSVFGGINAGAVSFETDNYYYYSKKNEWRLKTDSVTNDTRFVRVSYKGDMMNFKITLPPSAESGNFIIKWYRGVIFGYTISGRNYVELNSISISPSSSTQLYKGEFHDAQFKARKSTKAKKDKVVYNGDTISEVYYGTLLNNEKNSLEAKWYRQGFTEERELLSIAAEDNLRISPRPMKVFEGDIYGYIPYLSLINYNNISGKFIPMEYTYRTKLNQITLQSQEISSDALVTDTFTVEKSFDYGNVTKVTIKS